MATTDPGIKTIRVYHFNNGSAGGVLSVIRNLLLYKKHPSIEHHVIYTINRDIIKCFQPPQLFGAVSEQVFYYSSKWNFYYTCKKAAELIPDGKAVIVANDWLELGVVSHTGLPNPVIQILHGDYDYYYNLSLKHKEWINNFVTVSDVMAQKLKTKMPARSNDIFYLPFPVPDIKPKTVYDAAKPLQLIFIGRLTPEKGYDLLPLIEKELRHKSVQVKWHIVGGSLTGNEKSVWDDASNIRFYGQLPNEEAIELIHDMDCIVLPSLAEGMPVTVVEAMKVGLACIVNDLPGGMQELVTDGVTGFRIKNNEVRLYADIIEKLHTDRVELQRIGATARTKANQRFEPVANTVAYEELIVKCFHVQNQPRKPGKVYGSRLDEPWIPNFITKTIRSF